jgi:hypothetical protein
VQSLPFKFQTTTACFGWHEAVTMISPRTHSKFVTLDTDSEAFGRK